MSHPDPLHDPENTVRHKAEALKKKAGYTPWHKEAKAGFPNSKKPEPTFGEGAFNKGFRKKPKK